MAYMAHIPVPVPISRIALQRKLAGSGICYSWKLIASYLGLRIHGGKEQLVIKKN
jgi:GMP synthase-like glutamine amidotransferase